MPRYAVRPSITQNALDSGSPRHDPRDIALPDVQVQPQRIPWRLGNRLEAQIQGRAAGDGQPCPEPLRGVGELFAAQQFLPKPPEALRVDRVENEVFPMHGAKTTPR